MLAILIAGMLHAQNGVPRFEVISIKANRSGKGGQSTDTSPGRMTATNVPLRDFVRYAFQVRAFQLEGMPDGLAESRYDISATLVDARQLSERDLAPYLQTMLMERFGLRFHRETREMPVYSLTAGTSKLTPYTGDAGPAFFSDRVAGKFVWKARKASMQRLAEAISGRRDRVVLDNTSLTGEYDFRLEFVADQMAENADSNTGPSLFTAVREQPGLKLESAKGPVEVIVVEHLVAPSDN